MNTKPKRKVFFISDRTGITAETLGQSLLTQFESIDFEKYVYPFVDTPEKALDVVEKINDSCALSAGRCLIFATVVNPVIQEIIAQSRGLLFDFFKNYIEPLEDELKQRSSYRVGVSHGIKDKHSYYDRMEAVNFSLQCDDGVGMQHYPQADLILIGVSRCGKTPTSLYLAMQFGIKVANYPFTDDDMDNLKLPNFLSRYRDKLYGLTIGPERLHTIRSERRPNSTYASVPQCQLEVRAVENLFKQEQVHYINTTRRSIEEISAQILSDTGLKHHYF